MEIVYQDDDLIVINKPSGLLTVPGLSSPENALDQLKSEYPNARVVHRLDMGTSGLVIFAKHYDAQRAMGKIFEQRKIKKRYTAIVNGIMSVKGGEIRSKLICDWDNRPKQKIDWLTGKPSLTHFDVLSTDTAKNCSRLALYPHTGRSHQLRVHMLQIHHVILGDPLYGCPDTIAASSRLLLHATQLEFEQPLSKKALNLICEPNF
ncbi:RluA family pseudouridine synthase [Teredinibacter purpureus]|uniref:RluA family pseudouridine synthase n=1 Tax=Teredinibacter purpureus TaxID=2731756 RepID=UPI0005F797D3|nr:RluA family pseudouridine synthase [Teredinibacter purpureus]